MNRVKMLVFPVDWSPRKTTLNFARAPGSRQGRGGVGERKGGARDEKTRRREDEKRNTRITGEEAIDVLDAILLSDGVVPRSGEA